MVIPNWKVLNRHITQRPPGETGIVDQDCFLSLYSAPQHRVSNCWDKIGGKCVICHIFHTHMISHGM